jgi:hypothetical protein
MKSLVHKFDKRIYGCIFYIVISRCYLWHRTCFTSYIMKELKEKRDLQKIRFWDERIVREDKPKRQACSENYLLSPMRWPGQANMTTVSQSARENEAFSPPNSKSPGRDMASMKFLENWTKEICQQAPKGDPLPETLTVVSNFLRNNPNLESDRSLADLVLLCLRNYINADPYFAQKPFPEKLEHAAELAGKFIVFTRITP